MNWLAGSLLAVLSLTASADPVESTIRDFYTAYAGGDVAAARAQWDGELPNRIALTMRARCMRLDALRLSPRNVEANTAVVDVEADITSSSAVEHPHPRQETERRTIRLRRTDAGWKIRGWTRVEEEIGGPPFPRTPAMAVELARRAVVHANRAERTESRRLVELASEIAYESADARAISAALEAESVLRRQPPHSDLEASAHMASEALRFAEASGDADAIAIALLRLGRAAPRNDDTNAALFRRVLSLADLLTDLSIAARAATQLGQYASELGLYRDDMLFGQLSLRYAEASGDATALLSAEMSMSGAFIAQNDHTLGAFHAERARRMAHELDFPAAEASMLVHIAMYHLNTGRYETAVAMMDEAVALQTERVCDHVFAANMLLERANVHYFHGNYDVAARDVRHALRELQLAAPYTGRLEDLAMIILAEIRLHEGHAEEALAISFRYDALIRARALSVQALRKLGRTGEARGILQELICHIEDGRPNVFGSERQHAFYFDAWVDIYMELADNLSEAGEAEEALRVVQGFKGRYLREVLAGGTTPASGTGNAAEQRLQKSITQLNAALVSASEPQRISAIRDELTRVRVELQGAISRRSQAPTLLSPGEAFSRTDLAKVTDHAVVVDYMVGGRRTIAFTARRGSDGKTKIAAHVLPIERLQLNARVREIRAALEQRNLQYGRLSAALYEILLAPLEQEIAGAKLVCIIPNGELWSLPFHALRDGRGRYLAERVPVIYAPSVAVLAEMMDRERAVDDDKPPTLLAFANPNIRAATSAQVRAFHDRADLGAIPEAEDEVLELARLYGSRRSRVYIGDEARESVLKREAGSADVLHVASHALVDDDAPMFSALVLSKAPEEESEDGLLEAREITALRPGTRIAVLSACETGRGRISSGDGVIGMSWALLAAGCPTAVVSQWKAVSSTTATVMVDFHRNLLRGAGAAVALQQAQLALMRDARFAHPFYWAPFVVIGAP